MHHALLGLQRNERAALKFLLLVISLIVDDLIALWLYLAQFSGYKESDDSEKVILEPKLIAIQGRIRELSWHVGTYIQQKSLLKLIILDSLMSRWADSHLPVQYVKSWFWLDILSSIPVDYIFLILDSGILDTEEVDTSDKNICIFLTQISSRKLFSVMISDPRSC